MFYCVDTKISEKTQKSVLTLNISKYGCIISDEALRSTAAMLTNNNSFCIFC